MSRSWSAAMLVTLLAFFALSAGCAGGRVNEDFFDSGSYDPNDPLAPTPKEPETDPDLDAAVEKDGESVVDEVVITDDIGPEPMEDGEVVNPDLDGGTSPPPNPGFDGGPPLPGADAGMGNPGDPTTPVCHMGSTTETDPFVELDAPAGGADRLTFDVHDVPPDLARAVLRFDSFDANRPTLEGRIYINGMGALDLPANAAWANRVVLDNAVDVTPFVLEGSNSIEFGPGPLDRSVYRIGRVSLEVIPRSGSCSGGLTPGEEDAGVWQEEDAGPTTGGPVRREMRYDRAKYTRRYNWVHRCRANYAYTARGASHASHDCASSYRPDGTLRGTATFRFTRVAHGMYDILIRSRHSPNRNRMRALFIVNGERRRIDQRTPSRGNALSVDRWGRRELAGTVLVVLDSTRNQGSDSVSAVILRPVR